MPLLGCFYMNVNQLFQKLQDIEQTLPTRNGVDMDNIWTLVKAEQANHPADTKSINMADIWAAMSSE